MTQMERYHNDAAFKMLVDMMVSHIEHAKYTPSELRDAALMASIIYEEHHAFEIRILIDGSVERGGVTDRAIKDNLLKIRDGITGAREWLDGQVKT